jgi:hypothetical protein
MAGDRIIVVPNNCGVMISENSDGSVTITFGTRIAQDNEISDAEIAGSAKMP